MSGLIKVVRKAKPFFSRVDEAAQELPRTKGTGKEFMAELKKQPGVKKAELDDRKLSEIESAPKMTKQEFLKKLEEKPAPKVEETIKANPTDKDLDEMAEGLIEKEAMERANDEFGKVSKYNREEWTDFYEGAVKYLKDYEYDSYLRDAKRYIEEEGGQGFPKFTDPMLRLPGGENYREILLKLPFKKTTEDEARAIVGDALWSRMNPDQRREYMSYPTEAAKKAQYKSRHWDEPNVLAHIRVQDRAGPNGEKILHVEEIQSDWHQAGRKKGYATGKEEQDYIDYLKDLELRAKNEAKQDFISEGMAHDRAEVLAERMAKRLAEDPRHLSDYFGEDARAKRMELHQARINARDAVPDAPFKKNWHELATKRIMDYAIENGYDKVAITPGIEHVKRYEDAMRKVVDEIAYNPNTGYFTAKKNGQVVQNEKMDPEMLEKTVGGETARNLLASEPNNIGIVSMKSKDMTIGGELYKNLYDRDVVNFINKEYGPHGASVGKFDITSAPKDSMEVQDYVLGPDYISGRANWNDLLQANPDLANKYKTQLHSIDITPQMRETIQNKGQPLYQATGIGLTGAAAVPEEPAEQPEFRRGGRVHLSDNMDTMMLELASKRK